MGMDEMSFVVTTLERINAKLDKHDDKIDMIVQAMQQLVKVDTENKEIKESMQRLFKRVEVMENYHNTSGCPAHKAFLDVRKEQLKAYDNVAEECEERQNKLEARIKAIEDKPIVAMNKFALAVVATLGAGFGGWLLLKFGVQTK